LPGKTVARSCDSELRQCQGNKLHSETVGNTRAGPEKVDFISDGRRGPVQYSRVNVPTFWRTVRYGTGTTGQIPIQSNEQSGYRKKGRFE
jgi:hypothetical protein